MKTSVTREWMCDLSITSPHTSAALTVLQEDVQGRRLLIQLGVNVADNIAVGQLLVQVQLLSVQGQGLVMYATDNVTASNE